ncbi:unnamed protein product [Heligmosomoides polygyrus]|uniref:Uncharacterized protein n=1 Tax=Heligmosomoides polygyrus TaxID=6339 RepID=A0A183FRL3_HELPZ|nr:unnamed protein product [Heligmosomoides polygyrus]
MDAEKHLTLPEHLSVMDTDYLFVMHRFCLSAAMVADDRFGDRIAITLDVLFDFVTKRVIKIVLHTNMPGHYDFTIYARCEFRVTFDGNEQTTITTSSKLRSSLEELISTSVPDEMMREANTSPCQQSPIFNDICGVFSEAGGEYEEPQPVVVSRNTQEDRNPFGSTFCYGTDQIVVEVRCFCSSIS